MNNNWSPEAKGSAAGMVILRAAVAGYLIYLGYMLIRDHLNGKSTLAPWLSWLFGVLFILAGAGFGWFTYKRYRADTAKKPETEAGAELLEQLGAEDEKNPGDQMEEETEEKPEE